MLAECLLRPAQTQNCIVLTLVSPVLHSVVHSATLLRGAQDRQVHGISPSLKHLMKFPIERAKFSEARLKYLAHIELHSRY